MDDLNDILMVEQTTGLKIASNFPLYYLNANGP
jgi:hypothetical protein